MGYVVFDEAALAIDKYSIDTLLKTMIHEVFHALFFSPNFFDSYFPKVQVGEESLPYRFLDTDGIYKIRGTNILEQVKSHFNCSTIESGN